MRQKPFLICGDSNFPRLTLLNQRGQLPEGMSSLGEVSDRYTLQDALKLRLLSEAAQTIPITLAKQLASSALARLYPLDPFAYTSDESLFALLIHFDWPDRPEEITGRDVVAGRWQDIQGQTELRRGFWSDSAYVKSTLTLNVTAAAQRVLAIADELGLAEATTIPPIPENVSHYPDWFQTAEAARRALFSRLKAADRGADE